MASMGHQRISKGIEMKVDHIGIAVKDLQDTLNLYKKARLGNRVQWALKEAGYPEEFVEAFTRELVTHVALASRKVTKAGPQG